MPPSRRRRRSILNILNNHASILSALPILPKRPKQSCLHPIGATDPSQLSRTITSAPPSRLLPCCNSKTHSLPLRQWRSPQPSAFGHTLPLLFSHRASSHYYYFLHITLLLTFTHPPRFPVYKLRLGAPYWPPSV